MKSLLIFSLSFIATNLYAQDAYKWKDSKGRVIYGAKPPKSNSNYESFKTRGLSTYSEKKVLKGLGQKVDDSNVKTNQNKPKVSSGARTVSQAVNKPKFQNVDEVMLKSGIPKVTFDNQGMITACEVEVTNSTEKQVFEISVAFELPDGKLIPASGPFDLEKGASAMFFIPNELLPLEAKLGASFGDAMEGEDSKNQALPKVIIHSLGGD
jgi:hypothetical protein